jgi:cell division protein FtsW
VLFMAGTRVSYIMLAVLAAAPIAYQLVVGTPWRMQRFLAYWNPEAFASGEAFQVMQARIALGSGGLTGTGLGDGHQSLGYMPEAQNDFVLAPIGEELGFLGVALVLLLFGVVVWRGIRAALGARDVFGGYLGFGITLLVAVQVLFNVSVVLGVVPNKGITLPFVSYGGSSLLVMMFLAGLLLGVGRRAPPAARVPARREPARKKRTRVRVMVA